MILFDIGGGGIGGSIDGWMYFGRGLYIFRDFASSIFGKNRNLLASI